MVSVASHAYFKMDNRAATHATRDAERDAEIKRFLMKKYRNRNITVGLCLAAGVLGIYGYSMFAVKQENFLDEDFDKPVSTINETNNK